jgi:hypothetical protein
MVQPNKETKVEESALQHNHTENTRHKKNKDTKVIKYIHDKS